jgi:hypothetical protein
MKTIYKYQLPELVAEQVLEVPISFKPLSVQMQNGAMTVWGEVDTDSDVEKLAFFIVGTGHELPKEPCIYIGTVMQMDGRLVWHIYCGRRFEPRVRQL